MAHYLVQSFLLLNSGIFFTFSSYSSQSNFLWNDSFMVNYFFAELISLMAESIVVGTTAAGPSFSCWNPSGCFICVLFFRAEVPKQNRIASNKARL